MGMMVKRSEELVDPRVLGIPARLRELLGSRSVRSWAAELGYSDRTVTNYLRDRQPPPDFLVRVCETEGIEPWWLLTGEGERLRQARSEQEPAANRAGLSRAEIFRRAIERDSRSRGTPLGMVADLERSLDRLSDEGREALGTLLRCIAAGSRGASDPPRSGAEDQG